MLIMHYGGMAGAHAGRLAGGGGAAGKRPGIWYVYAAGRKEKFGGWGWAGGRCRQAGGIVWLNTHHTTTWHGMNYPPYGVENGVFPNTTTKFNQNGVSLPSISPGGSKSPFSIPEIQPHHGGGSSLLSLSPCLTV